MKKAAIYIRCAKDAPYLDLEAQLKACMEEQKDLRFVNRYVDVGYSGCSIDRPALQELIAAIETGKVDAVVVKQLASLSRDAEYAWKLFELFDRTGTTIYELQGGSLQRIPLEPLDKNLQMMMGLYAKK